MEIELHPAVSLLPETLNVLVAPVEMLVDALNNHLELQRYKILISAATTPASSAGWIATSPSWKCAGFHIFPTNDHLEENHHSFLIIEHDPLLYEDAGEMVEYVAQAIRQTSREATILLYSPALDPHLEKMTELADRVFCFYEGQQAPARGRAKAVIKMPGSQATLGGVLMKWSWRQPH